MDGRFLDEYRTLSDGAVWLDRRDRGRLRFGGADRVAFLQALVSNDVGALEDGGGVYATYLTPQGRMVADLRLYHRGEWILAVVAPGLAPALAAKLDAVIFTEDVSIADVTADVAQLAVVGARAAEMIARVFRLDLDRVTALPPLASLAVARSEDRALHEDRELHVTRHVARADDASLPAYDVFMPAEEWARVVSEIEAVGVAPGIARSTGRCGSKPDGRRSASA